MAYDGSESAVFSIEYRAGLFHGKFSDCHPGRWFLPGNIAPKARYLQRIEYDLAAQKPTMGWLKASITTVPNRLTRARMETSVMSAAARGPAFAALKFSDGPVRSIDLMAGVERFFRNISTERPHCAIT